MEKYLMKNHYKTIVSIVGAEYQDDIPFSMLEVDLTELKAQNDELFKNITRSYQLWDEQKKWKQALNRVQETLVNTEENTNKYYNAKENFPLCFVNLPDAGPIVPYLNLWKLVSVKGNVIRTRERALREMVQEYSCRKCKCRSLIYADRLTSYHFDIPTRCDKSGCKGTVFNVKGPDDEENLNFYVSFQEIKIQPLGDQSLLIVELEKELVESCYVGDIVTICGTYETRSIKNEIDSFRLILRAVSVSVHQNQQKLNMDPAEMEFLVHDEWNCNMEEYEGDELLIRDQMIAAVAPELDGLTIAKFGLLLVLCSGGSTKSENGVTQERRTSEYTREICHYLLVGDPGMGKSQLLQAASEISINSVRTVGYSATTAGLTATYFKEDGAINVEAGALVKANNGICCIDEINLMSKEHRGAIHEVMESQKITITKSGFRAELPTKCSIIAGMNSKTHNAPLSDENFDLEGSLRSRFDLIFELVDPKDPEFDLKVMNHILGCATMDRMEMDSWTLEHLQMHVLVAKQMTVTMSDAALSIIGEYYQFCRRQKDIDYSRTTMRMYQSLERLTMCHAKLMMRCKTKIFDAITVVMLMESSWSFGHLMTPHDVMQTFVPMGPTEDYIRTVLRKLNLEDLKDDGEDEQQIKPSVNKSRSYQPSQEITIDDIDKIFEDSDDEPVVTQKGDPGSSLSQPHASTSLHFQPLENDDFLIFTPPISTSTQFKTQEESSSPQMKKQKLQSPQPIVTDPILSNLNSLAAIFAGNNEQNEIPPKKEESAVEKLNKFMFKDESTTSKTTDHSETPKPNPGAEIEDDWDPWGDFVW